MAKNKNKFDLPSYIAMQQIWPAPNFGLMPSPYVMPEGGMQISPHWPNYEGDIIERFLRERTDPIPWLSPLFTGREPYMIGT